MLLVLVCVVVDVFVDVGVCVCVLIGVFDFFAAAGEFVDGCANVRLWLEVRLVSGFDMLSDCCILVGV